MCKADPLGPPVASRAGQQVAGQQVAGQQVAGQQVADAGRHEGAVARAASAEAIGSDEAQPDLEAPEAQPDLEAPSPDAAGPCATPSELRAEGEEQGGG